MANDFTFGKKNDLSTIVRERGMSNQRACPVSGHELEPYT